MILSIQCTINGMRRSWSDGSPITVGPSPGYPIDLEETNRRSDIPHPTPADRKDLESLVKTNWEEKVQKPLAQVTDHTADQIHSVREWIFDS